MLCGTIDEPIFFKGLQMVCQRPNRDAAFARQKLLTGPALSVFIGPVGQRNQDEFARAGNTVIARVQYGSDMLNAHISPSPFPFSVR